MARQPHNSIVEVIWEGKYGHGGARTPFALPSSPRALREVERIGPASKSGRSCLALADNLNAGKRWLSAHRSAVRLVYLDPPFNTGRAHMAKPRQRGRSNPPIVRQAPAYDDRWREGTDSFAHMLWLRLMLARELMADDATIFLHGNDHSAPLLRALLDDVFGPARFLNQIIWHYTGGGRSRSAFSNKHDVILWYSKGSRHIFNIDAVREPYKPTSGYAKAGIVAASGKRYLPHPGGTPADDVWDIPMVNPMASERTGYPTQKPLALLERVVATASNEGDIVLDLFAGSGTTAVAAERLGRRWLACDASPLAIETARLRLRDAGASYLFVAGE